MTEHYEVHRYTMPPYEIVSKFYYGSVKRSCSCGKDKCEFLPEPYFGETYPPSTDNYPTIGLI